MATKRCSKCGFECEFAEAAKYFSRDKRQGTGLRSQCKICESAYYAEHREEKRVHTAAYNASHREEITASNAAYNASHREERRAYAAEHREEYATYHAAYRQTERGKQVRKVAQHNRRLREKSAGELLTADGVALVLAAHTDPKGRLRCARCGKVIGKGQPYHLDHFIPLKEGGDNSPGNYRVMHPKCNLTKHATHPHKLGMLI